MKTLLQRSGTAITGFVVNKQRLHHKDLIANYTSANRAGDSLSEDSLEEDTAFSTESTKASREAEEPDASLLDTLPSQENVGEDNDRTMQVPTYKGGEKSGENDA